MTSDLTVDDHCHLQLFATDTVDPAAVVDPFLAILRAPYLAGPFKLVALDALQILTSCKIFAEAPDSCRQTLATVVDAVTRFVS